MKGWRRFSYSAGKERETNSKKVILQLNGERKQQIIKVYLLSKGVKKTIKIYYWRLADVIFLYEERFYETLGRIGKAKRQIAREIASGPDEWAKLLIGSCNSAMENIGRRVSKFVFWENTQRERRKMSVEVVQ